MTSTCDVARKCIIAEVCNRQYAIPVSYVREIVRVPEVTTLPVKRPKDRGVISLRGRVIPLIDLRTHFGLRSLPREVEDFCALMTQRENDHREWLRELDRSTVEGTEFRLATDPTKCAFGRWYYSYQSESPWVTALLRKFETPHNRIHALAASVRDLVSDQKAPEARLKIESARNSDLNEMISLFSQLRELVRDSVRELAIVITTPRNTFALTIGNAISVENIEAGQIKDVKVESSSHSGESHHKVAVREGGSKIAVVLESEVLQATLTT